MAQNEVPKVDKIFVATKAFVRNTRGEILLLRESSKYNDATNVGKYDIVGGRVEMGERYDSSLLREIKEETGLDVTIGRPFYVSEWRPEVRGEVWQIVATFFVCETISDSVTLSRDHDEYKWIAPKDYKNYSLVGELHLAFEAYLELENLYNPKR